MTSMGAIDEDAAAASALSASVREALAAGRREQALELTAQVLSQPESELLVTVALGERVRTLHELGSVAEARRLWSIVDARSLPAAPSTSPLAVRLAMIGADLAQYGAGDADAAIAVLRSRADAARREGDAVALDALAWDAVRRLGYAGRHRDLLDACAALGEPTESIGLELAVPLALAEALDGRPRRALTRIDRAMDGLDRAPIEPPLAREGLQGAQALVAVWAGELDRAVLEEPTDEWLQPSHAMFSAMVAAARQDWQEAEQWIGRALRAREDDAAGILSAVLAVAAQVAAARGDLDLARARLRERRGVEERLSAALRPDSEHRVMTTRLALGEPAGRVIAERRSHAEHDRLALPLLWVEHAAAVHLPDPAFPALPRKRMETDAPAIAALLDHLEAHHRAEAEARHRAAARVVATGGWLTAPPAVAVLTERQREVAGLVAAGLTNRDIARRLQLSVRTVDSHVAAVLQRVGAATRAEVGDRLRRVSS